MNPRERTLLQQAVNAFNAGAVEDAARHCDAYLKLMPRSPEGWRLCGRIRTRQSKWDAARDALDKAHKLAPRDTSVVVAQAQLSLRRGHIVEAIAALEREQRQAPTHVELRRTLAEAHRRAGNFTSALTTIQGLDDTESQLVEGEILANLGDPRAAEAVLERGLAASPNGLVAGKFHWRLGELRERANDFAGAFAHFVKSKAATPARFDWDEFRTRFERIRSCFTAEQFARWAPPTKRTQQPIFIAGLPRTGTTLLQQQLAAHPSAAAAGETDALQTQIDMWCDSSAPSACWPLVCRRFLPRDFDEVVQTYLTKTAVYATPGVQRIADKHPSNWLHVGLIAAAFPDATIIDLARDPMDTGLSCFERLQNNAIPWAASLEGIGAMLAYRDAIMNHWHRVLPGRIVRVRYEDLVRGTRQHLGAVLEAAGLPWDDACLAHETSRSGRHQPPPTLSADQVSRPIYDSSIGRAERFAEVLGPLKAAHAATLASLSRTSA